MSGLDHAAVRAAFDACAGRPADDPARIAALAALGPGERAEVESLLATFEATVPHDALGARVAGAARAELPAAAPASRFGPWRVTGELGEGGMGVVLAAERADGEFRQRAAIKLIRGFPSTTARERLRRERQILASLEHPHIARLLDGGTTPEGEPYLVMEYVDGEPLPAWLARGPPLAERIRLFIGLCGAVAYAHQRLVVHRDLKPGNVMVRADGTPVLLDFGIARLLEADDTGSATHSRVMTPAYASPEQLRGDPVTTATDVFGLGLVLYVMLGGSVSARSDPVHAVATGVGAASEAARASADPVVRGFAGALRGDLDAIVRRATRLEPARRYASVQLLEQDIQSWLDGRPVAARGGDRWYRFTKFAGRHREVLAVAVLAALAAIAFTAQLAIERDRARAASRVAQQEAATSREVLDFVVGLFGELDPNRGGSADLTALELLDRGRARLDAFEASTPQARAALKRTLGEIYRSGERAQIALELLEDAHAELARSGAATAELARVEISIAECWNLLVDGPRAAAWIERAMARIEAMPDPDPRLLAKALMTRGVTLQRLGRSAEAMAAFERAQALFAGFGESGREGLASVLHNRGWVASTQQDYAAAHAWLQQAVAAKTALLGADHPSTLNSRFSEAHALGGLERYAEAEAKFQRLLPDVEQRLGARSGFAARVWNELGSLRQDLGRYGAAHDAYRNSLAILEAAGDGAPSTLLAQTVNNLATLDEERGDLEAAETGYRRSLAWRLESLGEDALPVARARHNLARVLWRRGRHEEAGALLAAARRVREAQQPEGAPERLATQALAVELALARGATDEARREAVALAAAHAVARRPLPARTAAAVHAALANVAAADADAEAVRAHRERAADALRAGLPALHPMVALAELDLADALARRDPARARALRARAEPILDAALAPRAPDRARLRAP